MSQISKYLFLGALILPLFFSCSSGSDGKEIDDEVLDPNSSLNTAFDGKIFSIPSPMQTSLLLKSLSIPFNESLMNPTDGLERYSSEYQQALNLGVYSTDLGYSALYEQNSTCLRYLASVQKLTEKLGLDAAFNKDFMIRFEKNLTNQDSMLVIVSDAFKKADYFLKNSDRKSTSALILAGGWIESIYIASELNIQKPSGKIVERIGEQQLTLASVIDILSEYNEHELNNNLIQELKDLQFYFEKIEFKYTYREPITDEENKITTLTHDLEIKIDTDILNQISMKIRTIREQIIS